MKIYRLAPAIIAFLVLVAFTIINPNANLDLAALALIIFVVAYKILGNYALVVLLAARPILDVWRDYIVVSYERYTLNLNAAVGLILLFWSIYFFYQNRTYWKQIPSRRLCILFLLWCAASFFWSFDKSATITETIKAANLFSLFGVSFVLNRIDKQEFKKRFTVAFLLAAVVPFLLAVYQFITHTGMDIDGTANRLYGTFAHPNILATFALLAFIYFTHNRLELNEPKLESWLSNTILISSLIFIALTYTRIAWIGLAIYLVILGMAKNWRLTTATIVCGALAYLSFFPINNFLIHQFNINLQENGLIARVTSRNEEADSIQWRADVLNKVLPLWASRPLQGYGYGSFAAVWDENKGVANLWDNTSEAHNDYLKVGFEAGAIGLGIYLLIFANLFYLAIKKRNLIFTISILVYLVLSASDNMLHHTPVIWWWFAVWGLWMGENTAKNLNCNGSRHLAHIS
jgi:O-antigen ligase